ncbi:hypothetical protein DSM112329_04825 [Paraconexibacter sp. AEG42_29]|uniref:Uncharacterized protein n=2 Tax=Paraconexibacter sp. AEG42_29 TaxID=2997339 RepID=A0AAU7B1P1_9ACTN
MDVDPAGGAGTLDTMDAHLKALADISMALSAAEEFLDESAHLNARDQLDAASEGLTALRDQWPQMSAAERTVVGRTAAPLRDRLDAGRARLPKLTALTEVAPEPGEGDDDDGGPVPGDDGSGGEVRAFRLVAAPDREPEPPAAA